MLSYGFYEISLKRFFGEHLNATASGCVLVCLARVAGLSICKYRMAKHISNKFGLELRLKSTHKSVLAMIKLLYRQVGSTLFPFFFFLLFLIWPKSRWNEGVYNDKWKYTIRSRRSRVHFNLILRIALAWHRVEIIISFGKEVILYYLLVK